jgi:predicted phage terminase large subunit-like protein
MSGELAQLIYANPVEARRILDAIDARDSLSAFCAVIDIPGAPLTEDDDCEVFAPLREPQAAHHRLLISKLEAVEAGTIRRLMVFMPPGSAKSTYASVIFPVWFLARQSRRNAITATYASDLARKIGRRARSIVRQPAFAEVFGSGLAPDSTAADEWALDSGNEWMGGGILSGITGNRADLLVIDDPVKGRAEADSETIRQRTKAEFDDSLRTRLKPGGRIVLIQTRWHEDDLAGSILPEDYDGESGPILCRDGEIWEVLCIPAEANRQPDPIGRRLGEMLWPSWFGPDHWAQFKSNARTWSALYQQRPQPDDGDFFKREWFQRYKQGELPAALRRFGTSDYAVTEDGGDFTCLRMWGIDPEGGIWLLPGGYRGQATADVWIERQCDLIREHRPACWFGEGGVIQKAVEPMLKRRMVERKAHCWLEWLPSIHDKPTRARGFQARASMEMVHIPVGPDGDAFIGELLKFPAGKHDDDVDCASLLGRALDMAHPAVELPKPKPPEPMRGLHGMTWDEIHAQHERIEQDRW